MSATDRVCNYALFFPRRERRNARKRNIDLQSSLAKGTNQRKPQCFVRDTLTAQNSFLQCASVEDLGLWEFPLLSKLPPLLNLLCVGMFGYTDLLQGTEAIIKSINEPEVGHRFCPWFY